jgi:hypothetical protein
VGGYAPSPPMITSIALAALLAAPVLAAPWAPVQEEVPVVDPLPPGVVALAEGLAPVTLAELDETILWRHALTQQGRAALRELLNVRLIGLLGKERGIEVAPAELNARFAELDAEARQSGQTGGLEAFLAESGVTKEQFREFLRLAIVHERLTRAALGLAKDAPVTSEQQTEWLEGELEKRGYAEEPFPYTEGVVARTGDLAIPRADYIGHIRSQIEAEVLRETCYLMLLERAVRRRLPDLSDEGVVRALDEELARRRVEAGDDPRYKGITYEQLLEAKGLSLEALRRDPAIRSAALAHMFVDRANDETKLRATYEAEREFFDGLFGQGVELNAIMLNATERPNELLRRTFEDADARLREVKRQIESPADFERIAREVSDDRATRERGGAIGVITRGNVQLSELVRKPVFEHLDNNPGDVTGTVLGPFRIAGGSVLVMLGARRPAPTWEEMREHVHRELRRRFLEDCLDRKAFRSIFD